MIRIVLLFPFYKLNFCRYILILIRCTLQMNIFLIMSYISYIALINLKNTKQRVNSKTSQCVCIWNSMKKQNKRYLNKNESFQKISHRNSPIIAQKRKRIKVNKKREIRCVQCEWCYNKFIKLMLYPHTGKCVRLIPLNKKFGQVVNSTPTEYSC